MNTNNQPLLTLVEKLMSKTYVQIPICAICFEFSEANELRVFTIKEVLDQNNIESFDCNEVDLTLRKLNLPKIKAADETKPKPKPEPEPVNEFLRLVNEPHIATKAEVIGQTEHAVLINELTRTKHMGSFLFLGKDYEHELTSRHKFRNFIFGYIGIHPYTIKYVEVNKVNKMYFSIYWGIRHFMKLNPDAEKIPTNKIGM
jgi:hypothetical protein